MAEQNEAAEVGGGNSMAARDRMYARIGAFAANRLNRHFLDVTSAGVLKQIKESRVYAEEGFNWNEFCPARLGISRPTADEMIENLETFGSEFLQAAADLHLPRKLLQGAKALPEDERENIRALISAGDVDEVEAIIVEYRIASEQEVQRLRKREEDALTSQARAEQKLGEVSSDLNRANEVIARKENRMYQLAHDEEEFGKYAAEFRVVCFGVVNHINKTDFGRLTAAQKSNLYNDILEHRDNLNQLLEQLGQGNPDIFEIYPPTAADFEEIAAGAETFPSLDPNKQ